MAHGGLLVRDGCCRPKWVETFAVFIRGLTRGRILPRRYRLHGKDQPSMSIRELPQQHHYLHAPWILLNLLQYASVHMKRAQHQAMPSRFVRHQLHAMDNPVETLRVVLITR